MDSVAASPIIAPTTNPPEQDMNSINTKIRQKIVHQLSIYNHLSPSMLQIGLGTSVMPVLWKPVLKEMIDTGQVLYEEVIKDTPSGRTQKYVILSLSSTPHRS